MYTQACPPRPGRCCGCSRTPPWFEATRFDAPSTRIEIEDPAGDLRVVERFTLATCVADLGAFEP